MPLNESGSKASIGENIATEVNAGKPQKQAEAIAFSVQRRAQAKAHALRQPQQPTNL